MVTHTVRGVDRRPRHTATATKTVRVTVAALEATRCGAENGRGERKAVKEVGEVLPHVRVAVLAQALVVEAVHLRDLPALVVTAEKRDAVGPSRLHRDDGADSLHGVVPSIDVVA